MYGTDQKTRLRSRLTMLEGKRSSWLTHCRDVTTQLLPRSGRYFANDRERDSRTAWNNILDNSATMAHRVSRGGMMSGATSPARPWFKLETPDPELSEFHTVRMWLDEVETVIYRIFARSNTYRMLHQVYGELLAFGTAVAFVDAHPQNIIHSYALTVGEYCVAQDAQENVNTLFREFEMTVGQCVMEFGIDSVTPQTRQMWNSKQFDKCITVVHAIEPREQRNYRSADTRDMPFLSCYWEKGSDDKQFLRESGFERFPVLAPRWDLYSGDTYGISPAMEALGDIRQLQVEQLRKGQGIDYQSKPPLGAPVQLKNQEVNLLPHGLTFYDAMSPHGGIKALFEPTLKLDHLLLDIQDVRNRIDRAFYADLWLMIYNASDTTQRTAFELAVRQEEKMMMLGPVLERLYSELLEPLIGIAFQRANEAGILPPPPPELEGMSLNVDFVSVLAQAQKAIGYNTVSRWVAELGQVAQIHGKEDVVHNFDADEWARLSASKLGVPAKLLVPAEKVNEQRAAASRMAAAQAQAEQAGQLAATARDMASASTSPGNLLSELTGYTTDAGAA